LTTDYTYDPLTTRLTQIQIDGLLDLTYGYDSVGNVQEIYDGQYDETQRFEYDELDRLTHAFTSQGRVIGEVGQIYDALTEAPQTVVLDHSYSNPVVFAQPLSYDGSDPSLVRITDVQSDRFTLYIDEPPNQDGLHPNAETVSYVVLEAGSWELPDGTLLEVGTLTTNKTVGKNVANSQWEHVSFGSSFPATPVVLSQVQTENDAHFVSTRQRNGTATGFDVALEEDEAQTTWHGSETIGWLAIQAGSGDWSGHAYKAASTADSVTHDWYQINFGQSIDAPRFLASLASYDGPDNAHLRYKSLTATSVQVKQEEDTTWDSEMEHTTEVVNYLALAGDGLLMAAELGSNGPEDYDRTYAYNQIGNLTSRSDLGIYTYPASGSGSVRPHAVTSVANGWSYQYDANGNMIYRDENSEYTQVFDVENRLVSVTADGQTTTFTYDGDGNRVRRVADGVTTVYVGNYYEVQGGEVTKYYYVNGQRIAMRVGDEFNSHGKVIGQVGQFTNALTDEPHTVILDHSYENPVVFAQPLSYNGSNPALVRVTDVESDRFTLYIEEPPDQDGIHTEEETVSYVVLEAGSWELSDGTLLEVGTLTTNKTVGKNVSNSQWVHVSFGSSFSATPVVLSQVQTENDAHFVSTRQRNGTATGFDVAGDGL